MGLKARKTRLEAKGRKILRYESRWLRRIVRSERRFSRWIKKHSLACSDKDMLTAISRKVAIKRWPYAGYSGSFVGLGGKLWNEGAPGISPMGAMGAMIDLNAVPVEGQ